MKFFPESYFIANTVVAGYVDDEVTNLSRIYAQYRNKPKAVKWFNIVKNLAVELSDTAKAVKVVYSIDHAYGQQLDVLGRIVVLPRDFLGYVPLNPAMCASAENNPAEFGDDTQMSSALSVDQDQQMSDDLYRIAIKSKIVKNNSASTIEDVLFGMNFLLPNADVLRITDGEDMSFSVEFYGRISEIERWALLNANLVPKPQGVKFNGFFEGLDYVEAGDTSKQFGDTTGQATGFIGV